MARILVLDDEVEILKLVADELRRNGHDPVEVKTPQMALDLLTDPSNNFDLILCDVVMPNQNGIEFIKEVQRMPWFNGEFAMMSSYASSLDKELREVGVKHVLKKPFTLEGLMLMMAPFANS